MRKILAALAATAALTLGFSAPSQAADTVNVKLAIGAGVAAPGGLCNLKVPAGANGLMVLDAGVAAHCITSYKTTDDSVFGAYVECIDEVCGAPPAALYLTYWAFFVNGSYSKVGISSFRAAEGDVVGFSYTTWLTFFVPVP